MSTRAKKKRAAPAANACPYPPMTPAQLAEVTHKAAIAWAREPEPAGNPEAYDELIRHRVGLINSLARKVLPGGRKLGTNNNDTDRVRAYIRALLAAFPQLSPSPPRLYKKADPAKLRTRGRVMSLKTFGNHVRELRDEK